jgi:uncharacterized repeat protein (TIGR03843 family)
MFDILVNNADRKSGHCLLDAEGRIWAIDNGLTFHTETKLRTVIWDFADQPFPAAEFARFGRLAQELDAKNAAADGLRSKLVELLSGREIAALKRRAEAMSRPGNFPAPYSGWSFPWPLV